MTIKEVASPIDLRKAADALEWAEEVNMKRPWRYEFFSMYVAEIKSLNIKKPKILEIGAGPGYLAKILLENIESAEYTALDFSEAMHELSRTNLGLLSNKANYLTANFKDNGWYDVCQQETYDVVIIHQALHELRHKDFAKGFHIQVRNHLLNENSLYIVTDHIVKDEEGMKNKDLYMTIDEHIHTFSLAGFNNIQLLKEKNALCSFKVS
ncbi:N5-glutamine S-adenosyl-L-methionine-dependent methyltransferase [Acinetobacter pittii]|uniref:class I SAM-dependent methyltransferase n=2 Tax=Acinetobacter pittii TaxID=48296 RepID=UPI000DE7635D|nr:class I SAM-dependent methyltransferase [Acinetobacter pittii]SSP31727.1 N5-glutamine S-adenosyl-L-methionine-dependent methyltransferase [Acinetobacter pittii]